MYRFLLVLTLRGGVSESLGIYEVSSIVTDKEESSSSAPNTMITQSGQYQLPRGMLARGGDKQYVWNLLE